MIYVYRAYKVIGKLHVNDVMYNTFALDWDVWEQKTFWQVYD